MENSPNHQVLLERTESMKNIILLSSNSLATNPRLVKELVLARKSYHCTVVYFDLSNWSSSIDSDIRASFPDVEFKALPASKDDFFTWIFSSAVERLAQLIYPLIRRCVVLNAFAHSKRSFLLWLFLKKNSFKYDFIIAHNLAALYPAYFFAKIKRVPFSFDLEDYHPGETITKDVKNEKARRELLMQKILPFASYVSFASPLIGEATLEIVPQINRSKFTLVTNAFYSEEFIQPILTEYDKLQFVWFSQNISPNRGLEEIIPVLNEFKEDISITLIGNLNRDFYDTFLIKYSEIIKFQKPLHQSSLHHLLANFDVGLAIELDTIDYNRNICLTNKIFAYAQAGLFILATNTKSQNSFMNQYSWCGKLTGCKSSELKGVVQELLEQKHYIKSSALDRFVKSKNLAWEQEEHKLINLWKSVLDFS
jgi:hypothetical protein